MLYLATRTENLTTVAVTGVLVGTVYYHWYLDGEYRGVTTEAEKTFWTPDGDQARVECIETNDADFNPYAQTLETAPCRRLLEWIRSLDDVSYYRVDQRAGIQSGPGAAPWVEATRVFADGNQWSYQWLTPRLDDLQTYAWRIVPVGSLGDEGTPLALAAERMVRVPDAPRFAAQYDPDTELVTIAED